MKPKCETENGRLKVIIDDDCEFSSFYKAAQILQTDFNLTFTNKLNGLEASYWDFDYKEKNLVLLYNIYIGMTLFSRAVEDSRQADNEAVLEIGTLLFYKLIDIDWSDFDDGKTIGTRGSEDGTIVNDIENSNGARITLEKECGTIPFAITIGIYGLMFHTHYEDDLKKANEYIMQTKFKINKIFDLYDVPQERRSDFWQTKHDRKISELAEITETDENE